MLMRLAAASTDSARCNTYMNSLEMTMTFLHTRTHTVKTSTLWPVRCRNRFSANIYYSIYAAACGECWTSANIYRWINCYINRCFFCGCFTGQRACMHPFWTSKNAPINNVLIYFRNCLPSNNGRARAHISLDGKTIIMPKTYTHTH